MAQGHDGKHDDKHSHKRSPHPSHGGDPHATIQDTSQGGDHGHGHGGGHGSPPPVEPEGPPPPHVVSIARGTQWLGLFLWGAGALLALYYLVRGPWACFGWAAFTSVYGFSVWLAARDTIGKAEAA